MKTTTKFKYGLFGLIFLIGGVIIKLWMTEFNFLAKIFGTIGLLILCIAALLKIDSLCDTDDMIDE